MPMASAGDAAPRAGLLSTTEYLFTEGRRGEVERRDETFEGKGQREGNAIHSPTLAALATVARELVSCWFHTQTGFAGEGRERRAGGLEGRRTDLICHRLVERLLERGALSVVHNLRRSSRRRSTRRLRPCGGRGRRGRSSTHDDERNEKKRKNREQSVNKVGMNCHVFPLSACPLS
jgi:hypothetical protein